MWPGMILQFACSYEAHTRVSIERTPLHGLVAIASASLNLADAQ